MAASLSYRKMMPMFVGLAFRLRTTSLRLVCVVLGLVAPRRVGDVGMEGDGNDFMKAHHLGRVLAPRGLGVVEDYVLVFLVEVLDSREDLFAVPRSDCDGALKVLGGSQVGYEGAAHQSSSSASCR